MQVGECKHGERLKWQGAELVAIGVAVEESLPEMFFQLVKPRRSPGAGRLRHLKAKRPFMKLIGHEVVEEILEIPVQKWFRPWFHGLYFGVIWRRFSEFLQDLLLRRTRMKRTQHSEVKLCKSSQQGEEGKSAGHAVLLSLSHTGVKVKDALLKAECLADCRQDVIDAGCELHPEWANGAVLLMPLTELQAQDNQLEPSTSPCGSFQG